MATAYDIPLRSWVADVVHCFDPRYRWPPEPLNGRPRTWANAPSTRDLPTTTIRQASPRSCAQRNPVTWSPGVGWRTGRKAVLTSLLAHDPLYATEPAPST